MKRTLLILLLLNIIINTNAQRVGLVLSGGGAKGLYHVGLIKALEENCIPIDYVSGASMGAIVGGMYAVGYSPDEMLNFFVTDSVKSWLSGKIPDEYNYYFKRFAPTPEMISVNINPDTTKFADAFELPTNIISPYRIDLAFMSMIASASWAAENNFDSLMVPFRCVASDMYHKKLVVFKDGSLPFAIRASMTIPLAFKPLMRDSTLLYDGGVYNNFPWQTLDEDFQPDIYIGGICADNYKNPSQSNIVEQIAVMITQPTNYNLPDSTDITIKRRFPEISTLDYERAAYIMAKGYEDAMRQMPEILKKIKRRVSPEEIAAKRAQFKNKIRPLLFEAVEIEGLNEAQKFYVMRQLGIRDSQLITSEYLEEKYMQILATGVFTGEFPTVTLNPETGYFRIKIKMHTQPSMKLSLGGNLSSSALNQLYLGFNYRTVGRTASSYGLNGYLGTYYNSVDIGGRHDMFTRFPFYFDYTFGFELRDQNTYNSIPYYRNQQWRAEDQSKFYLKGSLAVPFFGNSAFRTHIGIANQSDTYFQSPYTAQDKPDKSTFSYASLWVETQKQSFNYVEYPTQGTNQLIALGYITGLESYTPGSLPGSGIDPGKKKRSWIVARYMREQYIPMGNWFSLGYLVNLTLSTQPKFNNNIATALHQTAFAPTPLSRTIFMPEFRSNSYFAAGISPVVNLTKKKNFFFKSYIYAFIPQEFIYEGDELRRITAKRMAEYTRFIIGGSLVYQTVIGPASLTATKFSTGRANWNIMLNFGYTLFSK